MNQNKKLCFLIALICLDLLNVWLVLASLNNPLPMIIAMTSLVACTLSSYYVYANFSKEGSVNYKAFMGTSSLIYILCAINNLLLSGQFSTYTIYFVIIALSEILVSILLFVVALKKDLGEKKSNLYIKISIIITGAILLLNIISALFIHNLNLDMTIVRNMSKLVLMLLGKEMVKAKYLDKQARGSK